MSILQEVLITGSNLAPTVPAIATGAQTPSGLMIFQLDAPDAATTSYDITTPRQVRVVDVVINKTNGAGAANTVQLQTAGGAANITDAITAAVDNAITRAGTVDDANATVAASGVIRVLVTRAAGTANCRVTIKCLAL